MGKQQPVYGRRPEAKGRVQLLFCAIFRVFSLSFVIYQINCLLSYECVVGRFVVRTNVRQRPKPESTRLRCQTERLLRKTRVICILLEYARCRGAEISDFLIIFEIFVNN